MVVNNGLSEYTSWVTMPALDLREVWVNAAGLTGMLKVNGGRSATSVTHLLQLQQLDGALNPTGPVITATRMAVLVAIRSRIVGDPLLDESCHRGGNQAEGERHVGICRERLAARSSSPTDFSNSIGRKERAGGAPRRSIAAR